MGMMRQLIVGTVRNNRNPVNLLAMVCGRQSCLMRVSAIIWLTILIMTIIPAQIHSHEGIDIVGSNWMAQQATNNKSAMLSRIDPVLLSACSLLANQPSTMSLRPQRTYSVQNCHPATLQNRRPIEPTILSAVMMLGKCFMLIWFNLYGITLGFARFSEQEGWRFSDTVCSHLFVHTYCIASFSCFYENFIYFCTKLTK